MAQYGEPMTEGQNNTLQRIHAARSAGISLHPFWFEWEDAALRQYQQSGKEA